MRQHAKLGDAVRVADAFNVAAEMIVREMEQGRKPDAGRRLLRVLDHRGAYDEKARMDFALSCAPKARQLQRVGTRAACRPQSINGPQTTCDRSLVATELNLDSRHLRRLLVAYACAC
jgi:hypothetical protein